jgi:hypothetical protein
MNIEDIKPKKNDFIIVKKKTIAVITILIVLGFITGFLLSHFFSVEANQRIDDYNERMKKFYQNWNQYSWNNSYWNNTNSNNSWWSNWSSSNNNDSTGWYGYDPYLKNLNPSDVLMPSIGVVSICIAIFLLIGLIIAYIRIFLVSKSSYMAGLMFVFIPLLIISLFLVNTLRALYFSSAMPHSILGSALGFGIDGLGGIISILSLFEIIGFTILLYLTME